MKHNNNDSGNRIGKVENLLLIGVLLFSLWGGYQLVGGNFDSPGDLELKEMPVGYATTAAAFSVSSTTEEQSDYLRVYGAPEAGAPLQFEIQDVDPKAVYTISFGDGKEQLLLNGSTGHTYQNPGRFQVKIRRELDGRLEVLHSRLLRIARAGDLAQRN